MNDTRKKTRFLSELSCAFGPTPDTPRSGTITSIGLKECFVKTKAIVIEGQSLHVRVWTPENCWLRLSGRVKYHMERVGFGVVFHELHRLANNRLMQVTGNGRARRYSLTPLGERVLTTRRREWEAFSHGLNGVLDAADDLGRRRDTGCGPA